MNPVAPEKSQTRRQALKALGLAGGAVLAARLLLRANESTPAPESAPPPKPPAPSLTGDHSGYFYRFKIGSFDAIAFLDGGIAPPADQSPFGVDEPKGAVASALDAALVPSDRVQLPFNVLLVRTGPELVLIDAGCGTLFGAAGGKLLSLLDAVGIKPEHITGVILTHAHRDHFGGLLDAEKRPVFPEARLFVGKKEHDFWMSSSPDISGMAVPAEAAKQFVLDAQAALSAYKDRRELIAGGDRILEGFELIETPGHTPGHLSVIVGTGDDRLLNIGDVATHHVLSFAQPGWRFAYDSDPALGVETRRKLLDRAAAERLRMFGGHMPFPGLGRVKKTGSGYEYVIEPFAAV